MLHIIAVSGKKGNTKKRLVAEMSDESLDVSISRATDVALHNKVNYVVILQVTGNEVFLVKTISTNWRSKVRIK